MEASRLSLPFLQIIIVSLVLFLSSNMVVRHLWSLPVNIAKQARGDGSPGLTPAEPAGGAVPLPEVDTLKLSPQLSCYILGNNSTRHSLVLVKFSLSPLNLEWSFLIPLLVHSKPDDQFPHVQTREKALVLGRYLESASKLLIYTAEAQPGLTVQANLLRKDS